MTAADLEDLTDRLRYEWRTRIVNMTDTATTSSTLLDDGTLLSLRLAVMGVEVGVKRENTVIGAKVSGIDTRAAAKVIDAMMLEVTASPARIGDQP
jgi:hypothetical protein